MRPYLDHPVGVRILDRPARMGTLDMLVVTGASLLGTRNIVFLLLLVRHLFLVAMHLLLLAMHLLLLASHIHI